MTYQEQSCPGPPRRQTQIIKSKVAITKINCGIQCFCVCLDNLLRTFLHIFQSVEDEGLIGGNHRLLSLQRLHIHFYPDESERQCRLVTGPIRYTGVCLSACFSVTCVCLCFVPVDVELQCSGLLLIRQKPLLV